MRQLISILLIISFSLSSCDNDLTQKIISSYPDGTPSKIEFYKWHGDNEVLIKHVRYYQNGEKMEEGSFLNDNRNGKWTYWHPNGNIWSIGYYKEGIRDGATEVYFKSGKEQYTGYYTNGDASGKWTFWDGEGIKVKEVYYENGKKLKEVILD